jgi:O-antigen ligase/polysaccharide polymerase Wzy-like membrane protein
MQMAFYTGIVLLAVYAITQLSIEGNLTARPREINLVLLLGLAALLSMPLAVSPADAWTKFSEMLLKTILIFVVIVNVVRTELRLRMLLLLVLVVSIYLSVNAINDYRRGVFGTGALESHDARITGSIKGIFENSNDLAMHMVSMIPIAVALGLGSRNILKKLVYLGATGLMVGAVVVTFSRGGFIGLVAASLLLVRRLGKKNRVATTGAMAFAVIMFLALAPGAFSSRLGTIFNSSADLTGSSSQRTEVLKRSVWVALRYPLTGVGIGNFKHKSPRNLETHNAYTQVAAEMGLAAMVVYIMFLVHPLKRLRLIENESYSKKEQTRFYYLAIGLQGSLVGFMVASFFGAVAYHWYVYYLVGYAVCLHRLYIMKFQPEHPFPASFWEHPFAKKTEKLMSGQPASQLDHV